MGRTIRSLAAIMAIVAIGATFIWTPQSLLGHDTGDRWTSSYWPTIHDLNSSFNSYVSAGAADYNSNSVVTVYTCSSSGCGNWDATDAALGGDGPYARTTLYYSGGGTTITSAYTEWNYNVSQPNRNHVARHEIGHGFGLGHVSCSPDSVMWGACSEPWPSSLQSHDTGDLDAMY